MKFWQFFFAKNIFLKDGIYYCTVGSPTRGQFEACCNTPRITPQMIIFYGTGKEPTVCYKFRATTPFP